jgi:hypothetical protein
MNKPPKSRPTPKDQAAPHRAEAPDRAFLRLAETAFEEWNNPQDEVAFRDL